MVPGDRQYQRQILIPFFFFTLPEEGNLRVIFFLFELLWQLYLLTKLFTSYFTNLLPFHHCEP